MSDSSSARQRRHRRHRAGDHTLCHPGRCPELRPPGERTPTVTPSRAEVSQPVTVTSSERLGERGRRLWLEISGAGPALSPGERVVLEEACRLADRLDRLDALLRGDEDSWLALQASSMDGSVVAIVVDRALVEARQHALALRALVADLRQARQGAAERPEGKGVSGVDELARRRSGRVGAAPGL